MQKFIVVSLAFFVVVLSVYLLNAASAFFLPLVIAGVIAYLLITIAEGLKKITLYGKRLPDSLAYLAAIGVIGVAMSMLVTMVTSNVGELVATAPVYQAKLQSLIDQISQRFQNKPIEDVTRYIEKIDFVTVMTQIARMITDIAGYAGMIAIYVLFILIEHRYFNQKLEKMFRGEKSYEKYRHIIDSIASQIQSYIRIKTMTSALTGICSYIVLRLVGVDFAEFWAFLIFLLNFIPTIGSIIATIFPCLLTLLQFESWAPFLVVAISLTIIQFFVGNYLEPRIMGKSFNMSGLVIVLSLTIWGAIWGVIGMFLSVPIMVVMTIVLMNFEQTRPIAVLLSQDGELR